MPDGPTLHDRAKINPVVSTVRLNAMKAVRQNYRDATLKLEGRVYKTPPIDAAIAELEDLIAIHLPPGPGGLN